MYVVQSVRCVVLIDLPSYHIFPIALSGTGLLASWFSLILKRGIMLCLGHCNFDTYLLCDGMRGVLSFSGYLEERWRCDSVSDSDGDSDGDNDSNRKK